MKHALVTGGAGFIGSHLVDHLMAEGGWRVTVLDSFDPFYEPALKEANVALHRDDPRYRLVREDLRDAGALTTALETAHATARGETPDVDVIVHLAARAGVRPSLEDPVGYQQVNVMGTQNLLELAKTWGGTPFVFASSSSVYGVDPDVPWREDHAVLRPISPYASTKVSGELLGHVYAHLYNLPFVALRFFTVYGPRQRPDLAIRKFAERMLRGEAIPVFGDGSTRRDYTYVDDTVGGVRAAMDLAMTRRDGSGQEAWPSGATPFEVVNLGNDRTVTLQRMIEVLAEELGIQPRIDRQPAQPGDVPQTWASVEKAQRVLGYRPQVAFDEGVERFVAWLKLAASSEWPS